MVKQIVQLHAWSIRVESEGQGKGTKFTITIPLAVPAEKKEAA
jgi:signal transduction histidine kinase